MKCPYAVHRITKTVTNFYYESESIETKQVTDEYNKATFCDCLEEDCGAYNREKRQCDYGNLRGA